MMRQLFLIMFIAATTFHPAFGQDMTAIVNVTIIDGTDHPPRKNATVIVQGKKIVAITVAKKKPTKGAKIVDGTDGPYPQGGDALHSELELLVEAGLTPLQALQAASRDAARAVRASRDVGTVEVGKTADLVLLDADPLENISNTRKINAVVLHGRLFSKDEISSMRNH